MFNKVPIAFRSICMQPLALSLAAKFLGALFHLCFCEDSCMCYSGIMA
jgi:hypothetical protein